MTVIDQYGDPLFSILIPLLEGRNEAQSLIKEADVNEAERDTLPDSAFAWPEKRAFPVHTKEHTIMSRLYLEKCAHVPEDVSKEVDLACAVFGIPERVFQTTKTAAAVENLDDYLLPEHKRLRVKTAADVKTAAQQLVREYQKLSVESRAEACARLVKKAEAFKVELPTPIQQLAGFTLSSTKEAQRWIVARSEAAKKPEHKVAYEKLANALNKAPLERQPRSELIKLADGLATLDKDAGIDKHYDRKLLDPMMTVFNTEKLASGNVSIGGRDFALTRLASLPATFYSDVLGDDFVREASDGRGGVDSAKIGTIIDTLPVDMKNELARHLGNVGIR